MRKTFGLAMGADPRCPRSVAPRTLLVLTGSMRNAAAGGGASNSAGILGANHIDPPRAPA